jgi:hypothetical protein
VHVCQCQRASSESNTQSIATTSLSSGPTPRPNILELELWHKWTFDSYDLFTNNKPNGSSHSWQIVVPKLALRFGYLRNAIMAIAAMHIALESDPSPPSASPYLIAALEYHNAASQAFRDASSQGMEPTGTNDNTKFTAIFAFTVINLAFVLGLSQVKEDVSIIEYTTTLFGLLHSIGSVILSNLDDFAKGPLPVSLDTFSESRRRGLDENTKMEFARLRGIEDRASNSHDDEANRHAIDWLEKCFEFFADDHRDTALIWPMMLDAKFARALESGDDDVCRLLLLHWAVLLHRFGRGESFAARLGARLADELSNSISRKDEHWEESIQWVHHQVELP